MKSIIKLSSKLLMMSIVLMMVLSSCSNSTFIPRAINTVNSVRLEELNLERKDYEIINTVSSSAVVYYQEKSGSIELSDENKEFEIEFKKAKTFKGPQFYLDDVEGIMRLGYLHNDYIDGSSMNMSNPEDIARHLAIYRIINAANEQGADGIIEPIISTNAAQEGKKIVFRTTVTAKLIKLKVD